jgi:hypothetical protein
LEKVAFLSLSLMCFIILLLTILFFLSFGEHITLMCCKIFLKMLSQMYHFFLKSDLRVCSLLITFGALLSSFVLILLFHLFLISHTSYYIAKARKEEFCDNRQREFSFGFRKDGRE